MRKLKLAAIVTAMAMLMGISGCSQNTVSNADSEMSSQSSAQIEESSTQTEESSAQTEESSTASEESNDQQSGDTGEMRDMTASEYAKEMGIGINLGNTMEAYDATNCEKITYTWIPTRGSNTPQDYETCWGAPITTQEMIDGMKAEGFNTVRIPVFWGNMMEDDGTYTINKDYMARVTEIVDYCMNAGVYAVVNIHHFDEFIIRRNDLESCKKIFNTLWTQIAENFKDYSDYLVLEGFNEYLGAQQFNEDGVLTDVPDKEGYELTNALNQTFVDAVRATGGNNEKRLLIVSGMYTNIDKTTGDGYIMPNDTAADKLMVSVHYVDNMCFWTNQIGGKAWLDYSKAQCELLKNKFTAAGIPVFIGETTAGYPAERFVKDAEHTDSSECVEIMLDMITDYGFVPVMWDVTDNMYSRTDCRIISDSDREVIKKISEKLSSAE